MDRRFPTLLLIGSTGQIGCALLRELRSVEIAGICNVVSSSRRQARNGRIRDVHLDLSNLSTIASTINAVRPTLIINASAFADVEGAEDDPNVADLINHRAVTDIGNAAGEIAAPVIHFSSDYVYAGLGSHLQAEVDPIYPVSVYAQSKWSGEKALLQAQAQSLIFRSSWIYGTDRISFPQKILQKAQTHTSIRIVADQIGAPTSARAVARATAHVVRKYFESTEADTDQPFPFGIYNLACAGFCSWYDFAHAVIDLARKNGRSLAVQELLPVPASEYPTKATRPLNSRLDLTKFESTFSYKLPHWRAELDDLAPQLCT